MTRKELIQGMIEKLPEDVTYDRVMYHLDVMKSVEIGLEQAKRGEVIEHDELFRQLQAEDEEDQNRLERSSKRKPQKNSSIHREASATKSRNLHKPAQKARHKA